MVFEPQNWRLWYVVDGGPVALWDICAINALYRSLSTQDIGGILKYGNCNIAISPNMKLLVRIKDDIQF
jgi:hypothetical protein